MPGRFINSPDLIGKPYKDVADYPDDRPKAQALDGRLVYKGIRKIFLVKDGVVIDFYDWEAFGNQYRHVQRQAQCNWGITWPV